MPEVNYKKLQKANGLCLKWASHFKIIKKKYIPFVMQLKNNPSLYLEKLDNPKLAEFKKDSRIMFYGLMVENQLIEKFIPCIFHVAKRLRVSNPEVLEQLKEVGMLSIRSSVWRYLDRKTSFFTFVYNGLFCTLRGHLSHLKTQRIRIQNSKHKTHVMGDFEIYGPIDSNDFIADTKQIDPAEAVIENLEGNDFDLETICVHAKLDDDEKQLAELYLKKKLEEPKFNWVSGFIEHYQTKHNSVISRHQVRIKVAKIKHKMFDAVVKLKGMKVAKHYNNPTKLSI